MVLLQKKREFLIYLNVIIVYFCLILLTHICQFISFLCASYIY